MLFFVSIIMHETGHYIPAKILGCNPTFKLTNGSIYMDDDCNNNKGVELIIGISGIFAGLVSLLLMIRYFSPDRTPDNHLMIINSGIIVGYIASSAPDIVRIIKIMNGL